MGYQFSRFRETCLRCVIAMAALCCLLDVTAGDLAAQTEAPESPVQLRVTTEDRGLAGMVRQGGWTPFRVVMYSSDSQPREVICRWILSDRDGDQVISQRQVTLNSNVEQSIWLYAQIRVNESPSAKWLIQVVDQDTGDLLATQNWNPGSFSSPPTFLPRNRGAIAVTGAPAKMGLQYYGGKPWTQHEAIRLFELSNAKYFPDRWYGYEMLDALVWTKDGPSADQLIQQSPTSIDALREWIYRGGHFIYIVPKVGHDDFARSELGEVLPEVDLIELKDQRIFGNLSFLVNPPPASDDPMTVDYHELRVTESNDADAISVLLRDQKDRPIVVAKRLGFGRVTMIGIDLADPLIQRRARMPQGPALWRSVMGWQGPAYDGAQIAARTVNAAPTRFLAEPNERSAKELWTGIDASRDHEIELTGTTSLALGLAVLLFGFYWLAAGPIGFAVLKTQNKIRHSWVLFAACVLVFSFVAWGGAYVLRPSKTRIKHLSFVDIHSGLGPTNVRVHSFFNLYVPKHGEVDVAVDPDRKIELDGPNRNLIASAGVFVREQGAGQGATFSDTQQYEMDAGAPHTVSPPYRSTAKQFEVSFMGELDAESRWLAGGWTPPQTKGRLTVTGDEKIPVGTIMHDLPGTLENLFFVYCPGELREANDSGFVQERKWNYRAPVAFRLDVKQWKPGEALTLTGATRVKEDQTPVNPAAAKIVGRPEALTTSKSMLYYEPKTQRRLGIRQGAEGYLGRISGVNTVRAESAILALSFYNLLPPPDYRRSNNAFSVTDGISWVRGAGRWLDLSHLTSMRQLIVIGEIRNTTLPLPLSVDGRRAPSEGTVVVRWICPVERLPAPTPTATAAAQ